MEYVAACRETLLGRKYPSGHIGFEKKERNVFALLFDFNFFPFPSPIFFHGEKA